MRPTEDPKSNVEIKELMRKTAAFAKRKLRSHPALGVLPEDLAQEAYLHLHVHWDPRRCTALQHMCQRVLHDIDALKRRASTRLTDSGDSNILEFPDPRPTQEERLEYEDRKRELLEYIAAKHKGASILAEWILRLDLQTSREIAGYMAVTPEHVDYLKRKLKAALTEFLSETKANSDSTARRLYKGIDGEAS
jgi:hypothetical protein